MAFGSGLPFGSGPGDSFGMRSGLGPLGPLGSSFGGSFGQGNPMQALMMVLVQLARMMAALQGMQAGRSGGGFPQQPWSGGSPTTWGNPSAPPRRNRAGAARPPQRMSRDPGPDSFSNPAQGPSSPSLTQPQFPGASTPGGPFQTSAPWISQFDSRVPGAGSSACYRAVRTMAAQVGVNVPASTSNRIQVATGQDAYGRVSTTPERTTAARNYIDSQLSQGRPVCVGVSHQRGGPNQDGMTGHFVMVTGKGVDAQGRTFYTFHDPATGNASIGNNPTRNRFYVDPQSGNLVKDGQPARGYVVDRHYEMSMVVPSS